MGELQGERVARQGPGPTVSGSCCCSRKAENSSIQSLELATLRPCHGGAGGAGGDGTAPEGDSNPAGNGEAHVSLFTQAFPAYSLYEDPRPTGKTVLARESPISRKWTLTRVVEGRAKHWLASPEQPW